MKSIIVHYHLFKNAGTTIDSIMQRNFPGELNGSIEGALPWDTLTPDDLREYAIKNSRFRYITSHQARLPALPADGIEFYPVLFLRHPIDRVESVYLFERLEPETSASPSAKIAREHGLTGFVEWVLGPDASAVARNFQVAHLAAIDRDMRTASPTDAHLEVALRRMHELRFFGLVERFDDSMRLLDAYLTPSFGRLDLSYTIENRSAGRAASLGERLARIRQTIGGALYERLCECNALDLQLYEQATARFDDNLRRLIGP
ncbi:sulfotransferase family 2 domain-containing protein [Burkholderia cepacia]|uniref:sulfotransferase family 2 domain-containing protein n=1 Tax=Burkholderia cepacia TaxID=292 RepID=UPI000AAD02D6|nr:sulfotransferase family 2 domain-containing protein [Burkholderia cepacia]